MFDFFILFFRFMSISFFLVKNIEHLSKVPPSVSYRNYKISETHSHNFSLNPRRRVYYLSFFALFGPWNLVFNFISVKYLLQYNYDIMLLRFYFEQYYYTNIMSYNIKLRCFRWKKITKINQMPLTVVRAFYGVLTLHFSFKVELYLVIEFAIYFMLYL